MFITHDSPFTHNHFTALMTLSGTSRMSWYQKKHSPTHNYRGHQSFLICYLLHGIFPIQFTCLTVFFRWSLHKFSLYLLAWQLTSFTTYSNHCLLFAAHAHTIATCFAVVPRLCHLILVSLNPLFGTLCYARVSHSRQWCYYNLQLFFAAVYTDMTANTNHSSTPNFVTNGITVQC